MNTPLEKMVDKEIHIAELFGQMVANQLEQQIIDATDTQQRIEIIETFLLKKLNEQATISSIVKATVDTFLKTSGSIEIAVISEGNLAKRRQLERHFKKQIGISPKQLSKVIRLQTSLQMMLNQQTETLTHIAYENEYFDQNHFIKDFKEFIGITPREFFDNENMILSTLFYK